MSATTASGQFHQHFFATKAEKLLQRLFSTLLMATSFGKSIALSIKAVAYNMFGKYVLSAVDFLVLT
jgi:hypothetical protein